MQTIRAAGPRLVSPLPIVRSETVDESTAIAAGSSYAVLPFKVALRQTLASQGC
jgi:hypothetical protein